MKPNLPAEPETLSDACLVERSLAGDRDAFGRIVARYQSPICALAYSACGNISRSEDVAQEIFITAWRKLDSLQEPARFKAWLYGMGHNLKWLSTSDLQTLINQSSPKDLRVCITVEHYRSLWHESPETFRSFSLEVLNDGSKIRYFAPVDDATVALLARKGIACPTYIQGRDFEVLGTPGRLLPLLAAFVLAISAIYLLKQRRLTPKPGSKGFQ